MNMMDAMKNRHSVRSYTGKALPGEVQRELTEFIAQCNREGGLNMQLVLNEPQAFSGFMAHYGKFSGVENYIALVGKKGAQLEEACGYYGEKVVLKAQQLGLNTCWVALTYSKIKSAFQVGAGEKLCCVIALGYGSTQGIPHQTKPLEALCRVSGDMPQWFRQGMEAALLAPTAMNQRPGLRRDPGYSPQVQARGGCGQRVRRPGVVPGRRGRGPAGPHRHESAEILLHFDG